MNSPESGGCHRLKGRLQGPDWQFRQARELVNHGQPCCHMLSFPLWSTLLRIQIPEKKEDVIGLVRVTWPQPLARACWCTSIESSTKLIPKQDACDQKEQEFQLGRDS